MKERAFFRTIAAISITLVAVGVIAGGWLLTQAPWELWQGGPTTAPQAAQFVPKQAPAMVSLLVNPERLSTLRQSASRPGQRRQARAEIRQLEQSALSSLGLDYGRDVQPWLGDELTLAVTTVDLDRDSANGRQPGYLVALSTRSPQQSQAFLDRFWQEQAAAGADLVFEQYAGIEVIHNQADFGTASPGTQLRQSLPTPIATAAIGSQFVLIANHPKVLRDALSNAQAPNLSLQNNPDYQAALATLPDHRIGLIHAQLPALSQWLGQSILSTVALTETEPAPPQFDRLLASLTLQPHGIEVTTIFGAATGGTVPASTPLAEDVTALRYLPPSSAVIFTGQDLAADWTNLQTGLTGYEAIARLVQQPWQWLATEWDIDIPAQVFPAASADYALGISNRNSAGQADWLFVARNFGQAADQATGGTLAQLDQQAQQAGFTIGQVDLAGQPITIWTRLSAASRTSDATPALQANTVGAHMTLGDYTLIASDLSELEAVLQTPDPAITEREPLRTAIATLTRPNQGYIHLDWTQFQPWLQRRSPLLNLVDTTLKPITQHIDTVTISNYGRTAAGQQAGLYVHLID